MLVLECSASQTSVLRCELCARTSECTLTDQIRYAQNVLAADEGVAYRDPPYLLALVPQRARTVGEGCHVPANRIAGRYHIPKRGANHSPRPPHRPPTEEAPRQQGEQRPHPHPLRPHAILKYEEGTEDNGYTPESNTEEKDCFDGDQDGEVQPNRHRASLKAIA